jgi:hypothetical protein
MWVCVDVCAVYVYVCVCMWCAAWVPKSPRPMWAWGCFWSQQGHQFLCDLPQVARPLRLLVFPHVPSSKPYVSEIKQPDCRGNLHSQFSVGDLLSQYTGFPRASAPADSAGPQQCRVSSHGRLPPYYAKTFLDVLLWENGSRPCSRWEKGKLP